MSAAATKPSPEQKAPQEPQFWKRHSPRGELPFSFIGSVLLHVAAFGGLVYLAIHNWGSVDNENNKPTKIAVAEITGGGGGLENVASAPGPGLARKEAGPQNANPEALVPPTPIPPAKLEQVKPPSIVLPSLDDLPVADDKDPFAIIDRQQAWAKQLFDKAERTAIPPRIGNAGGGAGVKQSGGGAIGKGLGDGKGAGKGVDPKGTLLTDQRRRELRWQILASTDGEIHLRKLQALKVTLVIPLVSKPGRALSFDLSKSVIDVKEVKAQDDAGKVRWVNRTPIELLGLAKALQLREVPQMTIIYLPSDLESNMARLELEHQGRNENEIKQTVWDVQMRNGAYDSFPTIVQQILRPAAK